MMLRLRRVVLDIDKAIKEPSIFALAEAIMAISGVEAVKLSVNEMDIDVMGLAVIVEGDGFDAAAIEMAIFNAGGVIHSVDQIVAGNYLLDTEYPFRPGHA